MNESSGGLPGDRKRVDDFLQHYNLIDTELRRQLKKSRDIGFTNLITEFETSGGSKEDADYLRRAGSLRNVLVHEAKEHDELLAIPTEQVVKRVSEISQRLLHPVLVVPLFEKQVEVVSPSDTLAHVFKQIRYKDFSQFPVCAGGTFKGILTENGLTRWLAKHVTDKLSLVDLEEVYVDELLREEEQRDNYEFAAADTPVDFVRKMFKEKERLEAVLITAKGERTTDLKGIITRWDMLH